MSEMPASWDNHIMVEVATNETYSRNTMKVTYGTARANLHFVVGGPHVGNFKTIDIGLGLEEIECLSKELANAAEHIRACSTKD